MNPQPFPPEKPRTSERSERVRAIEHNSVRLTLPPLTVVQQCPFTSVSYLVCSSPDNRTILFRGFVLKKKPLSITFYVSVWYGGFQAKLSSNQPIDWFIYHMFCDIFVQYE